MKQILTFIVAALLLSGCLTATVRKKPTSELKLRHSQLERFMKTQRAGDDLIEEVMDFEKELAAVELELLHRYQAGDKSAYLPAFR